MWKFSLLKKSEKFWHGVYSGSLILSGFVTLIAFQNCSKSLKAKVSDQASKVTDGPIRPQQVGDCELEDGTILPEFSSRYFYSRSSVNANQSCESYKSPTPRKCIKGSLNGDTKFSSPSCGVSVTDVESTGGRGSCSSDGVTANEGEVGEFFLSNLSSEAQPCQSVQVACVKSGNVYKFAFENGQSYFKECNPGASCIDPSNTSSKISFPNGAKVNFSNRQVSTSEQPCSESDIKQRLCVDGNWSPAEYADYKYFDSTNYENTYGGCVAATPKDCKVENVVTATKTNSQLDETFSDLSIKNGSSVTVYDGPDCSSSKSIQLTCNNSVVNPLPSGKLYSKCIDPNDLKPLYMGLIDGVGVSDDSADNNIPIKRVTISGWACQVSTSPSAKEQQIRIVFNTFKEGAAEWQSLFDHIGVIDKTVNNASLNTPFVPTSESEYGKIKDATTESCYRNGGTANQPNIRFAKEFYVGPDGATKGTPNKVISETTYKTYFEDQLILSRISSNATYSNNIRTGFAFSPPNSKDVFLKPYSTNVNDKIKFPAITLSNSNNSNSNTQTGTGSTPTTQPASPSTYLGFLENSYVLNGKTYIGGWACKEREAAAATVVLYVKVASSPQQILIITANKHRPSFMDACKSGSEFHGFEAEINDELKRLHQGKEIFAAIYTNDGSYKELGIHLNDRPKIPAPAAPTNTTTPATPTVVSGAFKGGFEEILFKNNNYYVKGWACKEGSATVVKIHAYFSDENGNPSTAPENNIFYADSYTPIDRADLGVVGVCGNGNSKHGFEIEIPNQFIENKTSRDIFVWGIHGADSPVRLGHLNNQSYRVTPRVYGYLEDLCKLDENTIQVSGFVGQAGFNSPNKLSAKGRVELPFINIQLNHDDIYFEEDFSGITPNQFDFKFQKSVLQAAIDKYKREHGGASLPFVANWVPNNGQAGMGGNYSAPFRKARWSQIPDSYPDNLDTLPSCALKTCYYYTWYEKTYDEYANLSYNIDVKNYCNGHPHRYACILTNIINNGDAEKRCRGKQK